MKPALFTSSMSFSTAVNVGRGVKVNMSRNFWGNQNGYPLNGRLPFPWRRKVAQGVMAAYEQPVKALVWAWQVA